jgi:two-component sensor histidine kinase
MAGRAHWTGGCCLMPYAAVVSAIRFDKPAGRFSILAAALACVIVLVFVANRVSDNASRSIETLMMSERLLGVLRDAETGQRGFLLTSDPTFLQPYENAQVHYERMQSELVSRVAQSPVQQVTLGTLRELAEEKFVELAATITLAKQKRLPDAVRAVKAGQGKALMAQIREQHARFAAFEENRIRQQEASAAFWRTISTGGLALIAAFVALMSWLEFKSSARTRAALTAANQDLEARVSDRTRELESKNRRIQSLLDDVSHRVGNNLATVAALLSIQARQHASKDVKLALEGAAERVHAIAAGQRRLRLDVDTDMVEAKTYLEDLVAEIRQRVAHQPITIVLDVSDVQIRGSDAISIVVLINELVTNAIKHAFRSLEGGVITVSCHRAAAEEGTISLRVADDGLGFSASQDGGGLGSKIIQGLLQTLNATRVTSVLSNDPHRPGTVVAILIPRKQIESAT